jgi:rod shape-determining protein MreC
VRQENRDLRAQIEQLRLDQVRLNQDASQARRLQALLGFKEQSILATLPAQVVGSSGSEQSRSLYLDKGERDGLRKGMAVITADGVVGKVLQVYPHTAQVLLINDQSSGLGAIVERLRAQGIVRGSPAGETLLEKIMADEEVQPGDRIITTGGDGIFPKGLLVGTVIKVSPSDLFLRIRLHPAADLTRLEEVLVITKMQDVPPPGDVAASQRAADILAERLPGVPDKPASPDAAHADALGAAAADAATPKSAAVGGTPKSPVAGAKPTPPHAAAKPAGPEPPAQRSPGPQAKPTHDSKVPPDLKPISQRMQ